MIPERIALKGFLSYDAEQVLSFDGQSLLLLWGPNGSGKSSVFDGITFALFGGHRGGKDDYHELINKDCDSATVEFDFRLDHQRYRVRRSLQRNKRGKATVKQEVREWQAGNWEPVADTTKRIDFDTWIAEHLGLNFETFTTSVLLVQGKADKLLTADPKERHQLLARIIGMDRYEKLHGEAVLQRNTLDNGVENLKKKLAEMSEVTEPELQTSADAISAAESKSAQARLEVERVDRLENQARRWAELQLALAQATEKAKQAQRLIEKAADIERDWNELTELRQALPGFRRLFDQRARQAAAEQLLTQLVQKQQTLIDESVIVQQALEQNEQKRRQLEKAIAAADLRRQDIANERQALAVALPQLRRLLRDRDALRKCNGDRAEAETAGKRAKGELENFRAALEPLVQQLAAATKEREQADHEVTRQKTLLDEIQARLDRFSKVVGDKMCRYCGQALTPGHVAEEQAKLRLLLADARVEYEKATQARTAFCRQEKQLAQQHHDAAEKVAGIDRTVADCRVRYQQAARDGERFAESCAAAYGELAEPYRSRVSPVPPADWAQPVFPSPEEVTALQAQQTALTGEQAAQENIVRESKQNLAGNNDDSTRLTTDRERVQQQRDGIDKQRIEQETVRRAAQEAAAVALGELSAPWQDRAETVTLPQLQSRLDDLQTADVEARFKELAQARLGHESLIQQTCAVQVQCDAVPEEARRRPEEVQPLVKDARQHEKQIGEELFAARTSRQRLLDRQEQRKTFAEELSQLIRQHSLYALLAKYLDRDWLQRHVMRQAEQTIVAYARDILHHLSGGKLCLQQRGEDSGPEKALVLEAYHAGGESPKPQRVDMLSGSERFRVAVSLALAIGQYASDKHRPIQSVIIDEGFGCLDSNNLDIMIRELRNLQGQLQRILVVSHQEEFAKEFTNGYRFDVKNGATQVKAFP